MNAVKKILTSLEEVFAPMDAEVLASSQAWAKGRAEALKEFKASEEYQALRGNTWALYGKLHAIAGGKTWYAVFTGNSTAGIEEFMAKNCAMTVASRNARIAKQLEKAGVTEVASTTYTQTRDGFDGVFVVNTNSGSKTVTVNTIRAGGYNIQCLHLRVLVKVK